MKFFRSRWAVFFATPILWWLASAFQIFPLGWFALTPLFYALWNENPKSRFRRAYFRGFAAFWLINWWLVPTIVRGSSVIGVSATTGVLLAFLAVTIIAAGHAFLPAVSACLGLGKSWYSPILVAAIWTFIDAIRCWGPLANSWGALAFTQTADPFLLPLARLIGQHGLTFLCVLWAACGAAWLQTRQKQFAALFLATFAFSHGVGLSRVLSFREPNGKSLSVLLVQTDVSSLGSAGEPALQQAWRVTNETLSANPDVDLIVWPETMLQLQKNGDEYSGLDWEVLRQLQLKTPLLTGAQTRDGEGKRWNEAVLISPDQKPQSYAKTQLVPFGERAPFVGWLPFLAAFAPSPQLEVGQGATILNGPKGASIRPAICFESCFPLQSRVRNRSSDFILVLTNDQWFAGTEVGRQHRAMGQMRAAENGVPLLQSCNGRYAFWTDGLGRLVASTSNEEPQTLVAQVRLKEAKEEVSND